MEWRLLFVFVSAAACGLSAAALDPPAPAELLLEQARTAPIEIFADVAFRLMRANVLPPARQIAVLEEVFRRAGEARRPLPMRNAKPDQVLAGHAEIEGRAFDLHLDALSLRARAIQLLIPRDPRLARRLFDEIPMREWPAAACDPRLAPDPRLYYMALSEVYAPGAFTAGEIEKREPFRLAERALRSATITEEIVAVSPFLKRLGESVSDGPGIRAAFGAVAAAVKAAMAQKPKCENEPAPKAWSNEADLSAILQEIEGLKIQERDKPEWAAQALLIMRKAEEWHATSDVAPIDVFYQRVKLWQALESRCPSGDLRRKALQGFLAALNEPEVIRDAPAQWLVHIGYPVVRSSLVSTQSRDGLARAGVALDEEYLKLPQQLMQASSNPIIAIYGQLAAMRITDE